MPGSPARVLRDPHTLSVMPFGHVASLSAFSGPVCRGAREGHISASAHQLHDLSARQACLPTARSCLTALPMHVPNVRAKLATLGGPGCTLAWKAQNSFWPGKPKARGRGQTQPPSPLRPLSIGAESRLFGALIMLLPSSCPSCPRTTSLARPDPLPVPSPFGGAALPLGFPGCALSIAEVISSLGSRPGGGGSDFRGGGHVTPGQPLCPAPAML